jgi:hypothetical protein
MQKRASVTTRAMEFEQRGRPAPAVACTCFLAGTSISASPARVLRCAESGARRYHAKVQAKQRAHLSERARRPARRVNVIAVARA